MSFFLVLAICELRVPFFTVSSLFIVASIVIVVLCKAFLLSSTLCPFWCCNRPAEGRVAYFTFIIFLYKLKKMFGSNNFSAQFIKIISHYKKIGYNINVLQQTACLVVNPITVGNFAFLFNCTPVGRSSDSMMVPT